MQQILFIVLLSLISLMFMDTQPETVYYYQQDNVGENKSTQIKVGGGGWDTNYLSLGLSALS